MRMTEELERSLDRLNPDQHRAVETIDGPLLVIAGPGTGKTQILSLRAANILVERDVSPENILCLTFTEAGAEAMKKRLVELIGREGYGIEVSTFHGFASSLRSRFPQFFKRPESAKVVSELNRKLIVNDILSGLDVSSPIWANVNGGVRSNLGAVLSFLDYFKRLGVTSDEFRAIQQQTKESLEYLEGFPLILELGGTSLNCSAQKKEEIVAEFENEIERAVASAPDELKRPVISTPGIYVPYLVWLRDLVRASEFIDEDGKTAAFGDFKKRFFAGTKAEGLHFQDADVCERALALMDVYDAYCQTLAERDLYDFQDMISEAIEALAKNASMREELQATYQYIQVDEFQDTNGSQMRIVDLLTEGIEHPNVMVVGDDDQAIMRFQGASVACIEQFVEKYHPEKVVLKTNYRSTPAIVDLGKEVAAQIETRLGDSATEKDIKAFKDNGEQPEFSLRRFSSPDIEYFELAKDIRRRIDEGFIESCEDPDEAIAVIASKHASLAKLLPYLRHFDIPFSYRHTANALQMEAMGYLLAVMRMTVALARGKESLAESYIPQIIASPEMGLSDKEIVKFAFFAKREHGWLKAFESSEDPRLAELWETLLSWAGKAPTAPVRELMHEMAAKPLSYYRSLNSDNPLIAAEFNGGIRAILDFVQNEIDNARTFDHAVRLPEIVDILDGLDKFDITVDASLEIGRAGAVRLTSAHSSKGLEFDLVYLLDSDDDTWHKGGRDSKFLTKNILTNSDKDDDDMRRLLFVAITRAKRMLEIYSGRGNIARELQDCVETLEESIVPEELDQVIETSWHQHYSFDDPEALDVLRQNVPRSLSATALNVFVHYKDGCENSAAFPQSRILKLPYAPNISTEFGTLVHAFLSEYLTHGKDPGFSFDELVRRYRQEVLWLDFEEPELQEHARRFDRIARSFIPYLDEVVHGRVLSEEKLNTMIEGDVPLYGEVDLMLVDDDARTIELIDFKTGLNHDPKRDTSDYDRQLKFYKLLIESHPRFKGYKVVRASDLFVEPEKGEREVVHQPEVSEMTDADQEHLIQLIKAVWSRIIACDFDTSAFESSDEYKDAESRNVTKSGAPKKSKDRKLFQDAYEEWLIAHS